MVGWSKINEIETVGSSLSAAPKVSCLRTKNFIATLSRGYDSEYIFDGLSIKNHTTGEVFYKTMIDIPNNRFGYAMAAINDCILFFGGKINPTMLFELDIVSGYWKEIPNNSQEWLGMYSHHSFTNDDANTKIFMFGGIISNPDNSNGRNFYHFSNELYTLTKEETGYVWTMCQTNKNKPCARGGHSAVYFKRSNFETLFIFGGRTYGGIYLNDLWSLNFSCKLWTKIELRGLNPHCTALHSANVMENYMYVFGGLKYDDQQNQFKLTNDLIRINLFNFQAGFFRPPNVSDDNVPKARIYHSSFVDDKELLIWGGMNDNNQCFYDLWSFKTVNDN